MDLNPLWIGFESQFQKMKKKTKKMGKGFESLSNRNSRSTLWQRRTFFSCSRHFLTWSIFEKNEDKVQNLFRFMLLDNLKLIYYVKNGSKKADRIPFSKSCRKLRLKGGFESLKYIFESLFQNVKKMDPRRRRFESLR